VAIDAKQTAPGNGKFYAWRAQANRLDALAYAQEVARSAPVKFC